MLRISPALGSILLLLCSGNAFAEAKLLHFDKAHKEHEFIVHMKSGPAPRSFFRLAGVTPLRAFISSQAYLVKVDNGEDLAAIERIRQHPDVAAVEANRIFRLKRLANDPNFSAQYYHQRMQTPAAWELSTGSKNVVVGVIDTGVNHEHPDLRDNIWTNPGEAGLDDLGRDKASNLIDDDGNGYVDDVHGWNFQKNDSSFMDDNGHGSHCAGIIGARGDNGIGIAGINWDVNIASLKFIDGVTGEGDTAGAVAAIEYATSMGMDIINASWGATVESLPGPDEEDLLRDAIAAAGEKGILFVAAAGNEASDNDMIPTLPAGYPLPNVVSVAATTAADGVAFFSNFGVQSVHLGAPGNSVLSTVLGTSIARFSGTSMAAPMVVGAAALLKAKYPKMEAVDLKQRLLETVDPIPALEGISISGGRLNIARALAE